MHWIGRAYYTVTLRIYDSNISLDTQTSQRKIMVNLRQRCIWQSNVYTLLISSVQPQASLVIWVLEHVEIASSVPLAAFSWKDDYVMLRGFVDKRRNFYCISLLSRKKRRESMENSSWIIFWKIREITIGTCFHYLRA